MVTYQAMSEFMGWLPIVGCWLCTGKNLRVSHSKVKEGLFREETLHRQSEGHLGRQERKGRPRGMGLSVFVGVGDFTG